MAEIGLQRTGIDAVIRQLVATGMPQHVRMHPIVKAGGLTQTGDQDAESANGERRTAFGSKHE